MVVTRRNREPSAKAKAAAAKAAGAKAAAAKATDAKATDAKATDAKATDAADGLAKDSTTGNGTAVTTGQQKDPSPKRTKKVAKKAQKNGKRDAQLEADAEFLASPEAKRFMKKNQRTHLVPSKKYGQDKTTKQNPFSNKEKVQKNYGGKNKKRTNTRSNSRDLDSDSHSLKTSDEEASGTETKRRRFTDETTEKAEMLKKGKSTGHSVAGSNYKETRGYDEDEDYIEEDRRNTLDSQSEEAMSDDSSVSSERSTKSTRQLKDNLVLDTATKESSDMTKMVETPNGKVKFSSLSREEQVAIVQLRFKEDPTFYKKAVMHALRSKIKNKSSGAPKAVTG